MEKIRFYLQKRKADFQISDFVYRLIAAYLTCLLFFLYRSDYSLTDFSFFLEIPLAGLLIGVLLIFLTLCLIPGHFWIRIFILAEGLVYCIYAIHEQNNYYFLFGCIAVIAFFIFYSDITAFSLPIPAWLVYPASAILFLMVALCVGIYVVMRMENNCGSCFDLGIFTQMYHYLKETGLPFTTCERDGLLSHFAVHISPVFYLLYPFYLLIPKFSTILIGHCLFTYSGIFPLLLICRNHKLKPFPSAAFVICYLLTPGFAGGYDYFIHENCFLPPLILWLIFCLEWEKKGRKKGFSKRIRKFALCLFAASMVWSVKEDAPIYVCCISLFFFVTSAFEAKENGRWKDLLQETSLWIFLLSVLYFVMAVKILSAFGTSWGSLRYGNYMFDGGSSLMTMLIGILKNPFYVITQILTAEKLELLAYVLLPLGFLPLLSKKIPNWILLIPFLLFNLMSDYTYLSNIHFQYVYGSSTFLIYLALLNYTALEEKLRNKILLISVSGSVLVFAFLFGGHASYYKTYQDLTDYRIACEEAQALVPEDASVAANTFLVPTWSDRDTIYELETTSHMAEYYVLDLRGGSVPGTYAANPDYEEIYYKENAIAVYHYLGDETSVSDPEKDFSESARSIKETLSAEIQQTLSSGSDDLPDSFIISGVTFTRVYADQGWASPSPDGSSEGVYMTDSSGSLVYMSYRNDTYCTTWSGPSEDPDWCQSMGGWNNGQGFGWTGNGAE